MSIEIIIAPGSKITRLDRGPTGWPGHTDNFAVGLTEGPGALLLVPDLVALFNPLKMLTDRFHFEFLGPILWHFLLNMVSGTVI